MYHKFLKLLREFCFVTGGPYAAFAGHDATHALATFNMEDIKNESADISGLTNAQMESVREWEMQFTGEGRRCYHFYCLLFV